jgi:hypothetical protein
MAQQPLMGQDPLIIETSQWQSDAPHSVRLLWMSDKHDTDINLSAHGTHKRLAAIPPAEFEPTFPARERPQSHALDRAAIGVPN